MGLRFSSTFSLAQGVYYSSILLLSLQILSSLTSSSLALKCYVCKSATEPTECSETAMANRTADMDLRYMKLCPDGTLFCVKTLKMTFDSSGNLHQTHYIRECAPQNWSMPPYQPVPKMASNVDSANMYYGDDLIAAYNQSQQAMMSGNSMNMPTSLVPSQANAASSTSVSNGDENGLPTVTTSSSALILQVNNSPIRYSFMCVQMQNSTAQITQTCYCSGPDGCNANISLMYSSPDNSSVSNGNGSSSDSTTTNNPVSTSTTASAAIGMFLSHKSWIKSAYLTYLAVFTLFPIVAFFPL